MAWTLTSVPRNGMMMLRNQRSVAQNGMGVYQCTSSKDNAGLSRSQSKWLQVAIALANANNYRWKLGAVVVKKGHVEVGMARWRNIPRNVSVEHLGECSVHAEMDAVSRMRNPKGATLYVARVNKQGEIRTSKPCANCEVALATLGIRRVIHT